MKALILMAVLVPFISNADEIYIGAYTDHLFAGQDDRSYNEDNEFIGYWSDNGLGVATFVNSYNKRSYLISFKTDISDKPNGFSYGYLIGAATGYDEAIDGGEMPVFAPYAQYKGEHASVNAVLLNFAAVGVLVGIEF